MMGKIICFLHKFSVSFLNLHFIPPKNDLSKTFWSGNSFYFFSTFPKNDLSKTFCSGNSCYFFSTFLGPSFTPGRSEKLHEKVWNHYSFDHFINRLITPKSSFDPSFSMKTKSLKTYRLLK